jgi:NADP-dependent 3-hydroxy acid dehydrogenase YdfG
MEPTAMAKGTDLQGQVAIITGASSGIGQAMAHELSQAGMKLVITARRQQALDALAGQLETEAAVVAGDIADPALPQQLIDAAKGRFGRLDVTINNAGVMEVGTIDTVDIDKACAMVRTNLEAVYRLSYLTLRHFLQQSRGQLINVSSTLGQYVKQGTGAYAGTKHAIEAFSDDLRWQTSGTGVRVSVLEPGLTDTHLQDHFPTHPKEALGLNEIPSAEDLAGAARYILEQPAHINIPRLCMQPSEQPD